MDQMKGENPPDRLARMLRHPSGLSGAWLLSIVCGLLSSQCQCAASSLPGPREIQPSEQNPVMVGTRQFSMQCTAPAELTGLHGFAEYEWYFQGPGQLGFTKVLETPHITFQDGRKLVISAVKLEHAGSYQCSVRFWSSSSTGNVVGTIPNGNWQLTVTTPEQLPYRQPRIRIYQQVPSGVISPAETQIVRFFCDGNTDTDTYSWMVNGRPLNCSGRFRVLRPSQTQTLVLHNVSISDHGAIVTCIANASSGKTDSRNFPPLQVYQPSKGPEAKPHTTSHTAQMSATEDSRVSSTTKTSILHSSRVNASPATMSEGTTTESNNVGTMDYTGDDSDLQAAPSPSEEEHDRATIDTVMIAVGSTVIVGCFAIVVGTVTLLLYRSRRNRTTAKTNNDQQASDRVVSIISTSSTSPILNAETAV